MPSPAICTPPAFGFVAFLRFLSRLAWDHPQLPWDGTRLEVVALDEPGATPLVLLGGPTESLLQPECIDARTLQVLSDRSGFWNPVRVDLDGGLDEGRPEQRDTGDALWNLGLTVQAFDPTGRLCGVLANPDPAGVPDFLGWEGDDGDVLAVWVRGVKFTRPMNATGVW